MMRNLKKFTFDYHGVLTKAGLPNGLDRPVYSTMKYSSQLCRSDYSRDTLLLNDLPKPGREEIENEKTVARKTRVQMGGIDKFMP